MIYSRGGHEIDGNIGDAWIFRMVQPSQRVIALRPVCLYCSWQLVLCCASSFLGVPLPLLFISKGDEVTKKVTESVTT
jgi:hypothetical protein